MIRKRQYIVRDNSTVLEGNWNNNTLNGHIDIIVGSIFITHDNEKRFPEMLLSDVKIACNLIIIEIFVDPNKKFNFGTLAAVPIVKIN